MSRSSARLRPPRFRSILLAALLATAWPAPRAGENGAAAPDSPFRRGTHEISLGAGWGTGLDVGAAESDRVELATVIPRWGVGLTDPLGGDAWYRGQLSLLLEGAYLDTDEPNDGHAAGASLLLRWHFLGLEPVVPFVDAGAGIVDLDLDLRDQEDGFNFTLHGGAGAHYLLTPRWALTFEARLHHVSNAGLDEPNDGINTVQALGGVTFFIH